MICRDALSRCDGTHRLYTTHAVPMYPSGQQGATQHDEDIGTRQCSFSCHTICQCSIISINAPLLAVQPANCHANHMGRQQQSCRHLPPRPALLRRACCAVLCCVVPHHSAGSHMLPEERLSAQTDVKRLCTTQRPAVLWEQHRHMQCTMHRCLGLLAAH